MAGNSVLGKDMGDEVLGELFRSAGDGSRNEDTLLGESVDYHQDRVEAIGSRKRFYEVHGNGFPRTRRDGELLESAIRLVELWL